MPCLIRDFAEYELELPCLQNNTGKNDSNRKQCPVPYTDRHVDQRASIHGWFGEPPLLHHQVGKKQKKSANNPPSAGKPEEAAAVTDYCTNHSDDISDNMKELWDWTVQNFASADKMSSPLQGATFKFIADWVQPKRGVTCFLFFFLFTLFFSSRFS